MKKIEKHNPHWKKRKIEVQIYLKNQVTSSATQFTCVTCSLPIKQVNLPASTQSKRELAAAACKFSWT